MVKHNTRAHAPFAPSSADRWLACPAAVRYAALLPPQEDSEHTTFGTACHELAEAILRGNLAEGEFTKLAAEKAQAWLTRWEKTDPLTGTVLDMLGVAIPYVEYVEARTQTLMEAGSCTRRLEERVTIAGKDCWGSLDCSLYSDFTELEIIDLKGGAGKNVLAENNVQLMTYAVGEADRVGWAFEFCRLTIVQPRRTDGLPVILTWECPREALRAHAKAIKSAIKRGKALDARPIAGDHCGWCVACAICPAKKEQTLACLGVDDIERVPDAPMPGVLTADQLGKVLEWRPQIEQWLKACTALALTAPPPGWKVVRGDTKRKWIEKEQAHAVLVTEGLDADKFYDLDLVGITEATKRLKAEVAASMGAAAPKDKVKERVDALAAMLFIKPDGKPTIARADDPRPSLDPLKGLTDLGEDE